MQVVTPSPASLAGGFFECLFAKWLRTICPIGTPIQNDASNGKGWTEWDLIKAAQPRYEGHRQPPKPGWGHPDDSDPHQAAREIDLAASHGVTSFLFHWYYHEDGPFRNAALDEGYSRLAADTLTFGLVWDNPHDHLNILPARRRPDTPGASRPERSPPTPSAKKCRVSLVRK